MKAFLTTLVAIFITTVLVLSAMAPAQDKNEEKTMESLWKRVEKLEKAGKPRAALEVVAEIRQLARSKMLNAQWIKAVSYEMLLTMSYEEEPWKKGIKILEKALEEAPDKEIRAVIHSQLGHQYYHYYNNNRHIISDRTQLLEDTVMDIGQWTAHRVIRESVKHFQKSLEEKELLARASLEDYEDLIIRPDEEEKVLSSLYELLALQALRFYAREPAPLVKAGGMTRLENARYFKTDSEFLNLPIPVDHEDFRLMSMAIYQSLAELHRKQDNQFLQLWFTLERLDYAREKSSRTDRDELYLFALESLREENQGRETVTRVHYRLAKYWEQQGGKYSPLLSDDHKWDKVKAKDYCEAALEQFPRSYGAKQCRVLLEDLLKPNISLDNDRMVIPQQPSLASIRYKNTDRLFFTLYKMDYREWRNIDRREPSTFFRRLAREEKVSTWQVNPEDDGDLQYHRVEVEIPELPSGHYVLVASNTESPVKDTAHTVYNNFFVTPMSVILRSQSKNIHQGYVTCHKTGAPMSDVDVEVVERYYDRAQRSYGYRTVDKLQTGKDGGFKFANNSKSFRRYMLELRKGSHHFTYPLQFSQSPYSRQEQTRERIRTYLYTDRAIYRPGQVVYFKGITLGFEGDKQNIKEGLDSRITLYDANHQEVEHLEVRTNKYGSFNGSFVLPSTGLTGIFRLRCQHGTTTIRVEEYKRPRFEVELKQVEDPFRLGEQVVMKGQARAYAGSNVSNARVRYEVKRKAKYRPQGHRYRYFFPIPSGEETTIAQGETQADQQGNFEIPFHAIPGEQKGAHIQSIFRYTVEAHVTDISGETRWNSRTVSAGDKALTLDVNIPEQVNQTRPMEYRVITENLDGAKVPASGEITVQRLKQPQRLLKERAWQEPDRFVMDKETFEEKFPHEQYHIELVKEEWEVEEQVFHCEFSTEKTDSLSLNCAAGWDEGVYRITITSQDVFGQQVETVKHFSLFDPSKKNMHENTWFWTHLEKASVLPGEEVELVIGTAAKKASIQFAYGMNGEFLKDEWVNLSNEKRKITIPVTEDHRGGFYIYLNMTKEGVTHRKQYHVSVPFTNKKLSTQLVTYRDIMEPGSNEKWKIKLEGPEGEAVAAEMLASMYDASLDQFISHGWSFDYLSKNRAGIQYLSPGKRVSSSAATLLSPPNIYRMPKETTLESFIHETGMSERWGYGRLIYRSYDRRDRGEEVHLEMMEVLDDVETDGVRGTQEVRGRISKPFIDRDDEPHSAKIQEDASHSSLPGEAPGDQIQVRTHFSETAFFYPTLETDKEGNILLDFAMPEAVTRWKLMALSHTSDLKSHIFTHSVQTQKELLVMPNMPRFLREGDTILVSAAISNLSQDTLSGEAAITLFKAANRQVVTGAFGVDDQQMQPFSLEPQATEAVTWRLVIPEGYPAVIWQITAQTETHSDGEEKLIPILPNRMLVTESLPMSVRKNSSKEYTFDKLLGSGQSQTLSHHRYTLEVTQNPAWYAVQALPYLADFPHECSEQIFSRYYANALATHIANAHPKIQQVFNTWRDIQPDALQSQLEKNEELKSLVLSETPWVMEAKSQAQQKRRIALLFDLNTMSRKKQETIRQLEEMQLNNGGWPWFAGGYPNRYISQHIVAGFGHLQTLAVDENEHRVTRMMEKALGYMDDQMARDLKRLKERNVDLEKNNLGSVHIHYLYARSFFSDEIPVKPSAKEAFNYYTQQVKDHWQGQSIYLQGMMALALHRYNDAAAAKAIMASIKDRALYDEEMGMYWRKDRGYFWTQAPIERQALLIEAFDEITNDTESVEEMRLWLLKQKQTQDWGTTKATATAIYALLLRGTDLLSTENTVTITVGEQVIDPETDHPSHTEAGTGYFKKTWDSVTPEMGNVSFQNRGESVAWGAVYWQYFEQLDKITGHETSLNLSKELYKEVQTPTGKQLEAVSETTPLTPGDRIMVRIVLKTDRDMEFVHLKDMRAAGLEPVNVMSAMKYQDGLRYYESTRDAATHFFMDYLHKGTYVFEYPLVVAQKGNFSNGITTIQCMYAPEFTSHSRGVRLNVEK